MMPAMRLDAVLGLATAVAVVCGDVLRGHFDYGTTVPLAVFLGGVLLLRGRAPATVLLLSVLALCAFGAGVGAPGIVWPATVAYATAGYAGRWTIPIAICNIGVLATYASTEQTVIEVLWLALVLGGAYAYESRQRVARLDARSRLAEERLVIARELHDVVAHTLAVVGIHLNVAADALDDDPAEAREALRLAQAVRGQAMTDLRSLVGILREQPLPDGRPDLAELVGRMAATGLTVTLDGDLAGLPTPVAQAVYRVVQEGLTNVLKHAGATTASVTVARAADQVTVTVLDNGRGRPVKREGHGLTGMRERVAALGGTVIAAPVPRGFELSARLPL
jgi:signal transduction histidine kinase